MSFLDLVRAVGEKSLTKCHEECDPKYHRMEAAQYLTVLIENPALMRDLHAVIAYKTKTCPCCGAPGVEPRSDVYGPGATGLKCYECGWVCFE
jgi:hypothetical protein